MPDLRDAAYYDEESASVERKRKMLQALMNEPAPSSGYKGKFYVPDGGQLQKSITNAFGAFDQRDLDSRIKDIAQGRSALQEQAMSEVPQDIPADPGQVGTGPLAPPPGTPGVEDSGGGMTPMNTPEPGPNADPAAFRATPPDTPAGWVGPGGGMVPKGSEFTPNRAATSMIPSSVSDWGKWGGKYASLSPFNAALAAHGAKTAMDAPIKEREAEAARAAKAEENRLNRQAKADAKADDDIRWEKRYAYQRADEEARDTRRNVDMAQRQQENIALIASLRPPHAGGAGGTGEVAGDFTKTGDEFLATLPAPEQAVIKKIAAGEIPLTTFSTKGGHRESLAKQVSAYDPSYNVTRPAAWKEFTTGTTARNITSINTSLGHIGTMADMADAMKNGDVRVINGVVNRIATELGDPRINNFETARQAVSEELMRTFRVVGASEREAREWSERFKSSNSPELLQGALRTAGELLNSRIKALDDQWKRGTQSKQGFPGLISEDNDAALKRLGVKRTGSAPAATAAGNAAPAASGGGDVKARAQAAWGAYEPDKYDYQINASGKVQRKPK